LNARGEILKAADKLFGKVGFDAATTREIAELSGVNKALIHYHFKSKEELFEKVLDRYYERLNETLQKASEKEGAWRDRMRRLIDVYVDFLAKNLNFSRIVQRESSGGKHLDRISGHLVPMFERTVELLNEAYPRSRNSALAAHHLLVSFYGMIVTYFTYNSVLARLIKRNPLSGKEIESRKRHLHLMLDLVEKGLREEQAGKRVER